MVAEQGVAVNLGLADGAGLGLAAQLDGFFLDFLVLGGAASGSVFSAVSWASTSARSSSVMLA